MRLHERVMPYQKARLDFAVMVVEFCDKHRDLTYLELLSVMNESVATQLKYAIREERHPDDPEKRGGEE